MEGNQRVVSVGGKKFEPDKCILLYPIRLAVHDSDSNFLPDTAGTQLLVFVSRRREPLPALESGLTDTKPHWLLQSLEQPTYLGT